jgi:tRNA nucleotidyltransferase/poly(A) polymerase
MMTNYEVGATLRWLHEHFRQEALNHTFIVGGAVRDYLTYTTIKDVDLVVDLVESGLTMDEVLAPLTHAGASGTINNYGVAIVTLPPEVAQDSVAKNRYVVEIAAARRESYGGSEGKGYKPTEVANATLLEDILRRDFTVNTLILPLAGCAYGLPPRHEAVDLTGRGFRDLLCRRLDTVGSPERTFRDDPSRLLRLAKFEKRGFDPSNEVYSALRATASTLKGIPHQAVTTHFLKILEMDDMLGSLHLLARLQLLPVVAEILNTTPAARECVRNWAGGQSVQDQGVLAAYALPVAAWYGRAAKDLSTAQLSRVCDETDDPRRWFAVYAQPGIVLDTEALASEFQLQGEGFARLQRLARDILVGWPKVYQSPEVFTTRVRVELQRGEGYPV